MAAKSIPKKIPVPDSSPGKKEKADPAAEGWSGLTEVEMTKLFEWVDATPLSKVPKNMARDFSDGVLLAEAIHHHVPRLVEVHNYNQANSYKKKKINWDTLNRKVLSKLKATVTDEQILSISECKAGAIEQVLWDVRQKILAIPPSGLPKPVSRPRRPPTAVAKPSYLDLPVFQDDPSLDNTAPENGTKVVPDTLIKTGILGYGMNKMVPVSYLEQKQRENDKLIAANKDYTKKIMNMEALIAVKEQRLDFLIQQNDFLKSRSEYRQLRVPLSSLFPELA